VNLAGVPTAQCTNLLAGETVTSMHCCIGIEQEASADGAFDDHMAICPQVWNRSRRGGSAFKLRTWRQITCGPISSSTRHRISSPARRRSVG
jgi:hypothetical protein